MEPVQAAQAPQDNLPMMVHLWNINSFLQTAGLRENRNVVGQRRA
jgi:hypothetical protein